MSRPITWQNVNTPTSDPLQALALAQSSFKSVFAGLGDTLKQYENTADANQKQIRDNNTQAFLDSINKYRTPEEYQAALASGELDAGKYGAQIDRAAARAAMDGRLSVLQDRTVKANQFADQQQERDARPIVDRLNVMALSEDKDLRKSAKEALGIYAGNGMLPKASEIAGKMRDTDHQNVEWDRAEKKFADDMLTTASKRRVDNAHINQANAAAEHYRAESSSSTASLKAALAASKAEKAAAELLIKNSPMDAGTMNTYEGKTKFMEGLKKLGIPADEAESAYRTLADTYGNGVRVGVNDKGEDIRIGLPVSTALSAVEAAGMDSALRPNWLVGSGRGDRTIKKVESLMREPTYVESLQQALQAQGIQYRALRNAEENPAVSIKSNSRTSARSVIPKPSDSMDDSGSAVISSVMEARKAKAMSMLTPEELSIAQKTGKVPFRVKRLLETGE